MSLSLPVYKLGNNYVLHLRIAGKQVKRSLATSDPAVARMRAIQLISQLTAAVPISQQPGAFEFTGIGRGAEPATQTAGPVLATGSNEQQLFAANYLSPAEPQLLIRNAHQLPTFAAPRLALVNSEKFKIRKVFDEYIAIKKIKDVTKWDYSKYSKDIVPFFKNKDIRAVTEADVSDLILHLRTKLRNDPRTVDNKVGFLRAVINHLIKQGAFIGKNPAASKNLVSKREKRQSGTKPIDYSDLKQIFGGAKFAALRETKPNIYLITFVGLVTGMRVSSVARLDPADLKVSMRGTPYIDISGDKTVAGNRDVPIPQTLFDALKEYLEGKDGFGLVRRGSGKGYSDAVNKPIKAFLKENHFDGLHEKLSFHAFRKSFNDHLLRQGVEQYICGAVLGHVEFMLSKISRGLSWPRSRETSTITSLARPWQIASSSAWLVAINSLNSS